MQTAKYQPWWPRGEPKGLFTALIFFETTTTAVLCSPTDHLRNHVNAIKFLNTNRIATSQLAVHDSRENYVQEFKMHILGQLLAAPAHLCSTRDYKNQCCRKRIWTAKTKECQRDLEVQKRDINDCFQNLLLGFFSCDVMWLESFSKRVWSLTKRQHF